MDDRTIDRVTIESASAEALAITCTAPADPTGAAVEFEITSNDATSPAGSWSAGSWESSWDSTTKKATAHTPTIGAAGTLTITEGSYHRLWVRYSSSVVKLAAIIRAT